MKRSYKRMFFLLALFGVVGWLVVSKLESTASGERKKQKKGGPSSVLVTTYEVQPRELVDTLSTVGTLRAEESVAVKNEVPGKVVEIGFEEGERVKKGARLLQMRSATLRAQLEVKQRRRDLLKTQVERQRRVLEKGGISQQQFDITQNELAVVEAELDEIRAELAKTSVHAPFAGTIGLRDVSEGAILTTGTRIAELNRLDPIEVEFTVPERYADRVERGDTIRFRVHASEDVHQAKVHALESQIDADNRVLRVRARTDNSERELRPGAYAQVRFPLGRLEEALVVPTPAVVTSGDETSLWVSVDGEAEKRTVETGMRTEGYVHITEGLSPGDVVVTTGRQNLKPGVSLEVDTSEDAMDTEKIGPDPSRSGMRNQWFSEETMEAPIRGSRPEAESSRGERERGRATEEADTSSDSDGKHGAEREGDE